MTIRFLQLLLITNLVMALAGCLGRGQPDVVPASQSPHAGHIESLDQERLQEIAASAEGIKEASAHNPHEPSKAAIVSESDLILAWAGFDPTQRMRDAATARVDASLQQDVDLSAKLVTQAIDTIAGMHEQRREHERLRAEDEARMDAEYQAKITELEKTIVDARRDRAAWILSGLGGICIIAALGMVVFGILSKSLEFHQIIAAGFLAVAGGGLVFSVQLLDHAWMPAIVGGSAILLAVAVIFALMATVMRRKKAREAESEARTLRRVIQTVDHLPPNSKLTIKQALGNAMDEEEKDVIRRAKSNRTKLGTT